MTLYGGLLRLYPKDFRAEYGEDMEQLLRLQLREEGSARVWGRAVLDLALTVPSTHLEVRMSSTSSAPVLYGTAAVASLVVAGAAGTAIGLGVVGVAAALLFGGLALVSVRRARVLGDSRGADHWWRYLAAGATGLAAVVAIGMSVGELPQARWLVFMMALVTSVVLLAVGVVLGLVRLSAPDRPV